MNQHAPRIIAVIGGIALISAAFGLGYERALPRELSAPAGAKDVASAVHAALLNPNQLEGAADLAGILASLDAQNLEVIVGAYEATFTAVGPSEVAMELLAEAWSRIDPAGAVERMQGWKPYRRDMALPHLMRSWARRDVASARAAVAAIEPEELRVRAARAVILGWIDNGDPAFWDAYLAGLPFGAQAAPDVIRQIGAREGVEALLARVVAVPEDTGQFRAFALRQAVDFAAQSDLARAAEFAEAHGESVRGLERIVAARWAQSDGPRATEWALSRPAGRVRDVTVRAAFENWLQSDEPAALDWAGRQREEVLAAIRAPYANALGASDPQRGLELSVAIADETERALTQRSLARRWLAKDPAVAESWLKQNELADLVAGKRPARGGGRAPGSAMTPLGDGKEG